MVERVRDECAKFIFDDNAFTTEIWNVSVCAFHFAEQSHPGVGNRSSSGRIKTSCL